MQGGQVLESADFSSATASIGLAFKVVFQLTDNRRLDSSAQFFLQLIFKASWFLGEKKRFRQKSAERTAGFSSTGFFVIVK